MPSARSRPPARRAWALAAGAALVVQVLVLYAPHAPSAATAVPGADKLAHLAVFAAVTFTALRAGLFPALVVGFGVAHAVVSEVVQHTLLPGRSGDPLDAVADVLGVLAGVALARAVVRQRRATT
ncbi:VanZ family protein [Georgenia thermotolerans]|uniref:VanZ family protein n=1 Tax=Georgenia thermotolerans TaxID=527326 RepID=A0A7J5UJB2_9MICO|nr:VanZ family protein [Georgenia thermotolerans]